MVLSLLTGSAQQVITIKERNTLETGIHAFSI